MRPHKRIAGLIVGEPGSGKSTFEERWTREIATQHATIASVFVLDLVRDRVWDDGPIVESYEAYRALCRDEAARYYKWFQEKNGFPPTPTQLPEALPRRVIWRLSDAASPVDFAPALREAVDEGDVVVVFAEASAWFPAAGRDRWPLERVRDDVTMEALLRLGRAHILNRAGERCAFHFIADTQYPADVHRLLRDVSTTVVTSCIEGESTLRWIRQNFGADSAELVQRVQRLEPHEFTALRGHMPRLAPFRTA